MEQNQNRRVDSRETEAASDGPASPSNPLVERNDPSPPEPARPGDGGSGIEALVSDCLAETFVAGGRSPRHDGWTPERVGIFLRALAAGGVIEDAAEAAGLSATSAYDFRNRRSGRAFARMWDAIFIHRARARVVGVNTSRAIKGCVSLRKRDGVVVEEYHHPDNRLSMALLTRLDRLAEKEAPNADHLRALSEDMEEFIECLESNGDPDAFVEARKPAPPPDPATEADVQPRRRLIHAPDARLDFLARFSGCPDYRDVAPIDIDVSDLDPTRTEDWCSDQWIRGFRSGFLGWLEIMQRDPDYLPGPDSAAEFAARLAAVPDEELYHEMSREGRSHEIRIDDLKWEEARCWTADQWQRAYYSGLLDTILEDLGDRSVRDDEDDEDEAEDG